ncbi:MAG: EF-hand domain-containing protein [Burkholderiales bacterium]|nr:EF-hand domain-containing protein [Burkholderiales bacterium]
MNVKQITGAIAVAATLFTAGGALAQPANAEFFPFSEIMSMKMMDKNKDGMVSKQEFMDMMSMAWDMNYKKMNGKAGMMDDAQMKQFLMYLKAGG